MTLAIALNDEQTVHIQKLSAELGVAPDELARAGILDLLTYEQSDFAAVADSIIKKNHALYERLS